MHDKIVHVLSTENDSVELIGSVQYFKRLYVIRSNVDNLLDIARDLYTQLIGELNGEYNQSLLIILMYKHELYFLHLILSQK